MHGFEAFQNLDPALLVESLSPYLTEERKQKIDSILSHRTNQVSVVLESVYDWGNINAVMRTSESFGFLPFHIIESVKTKSCNRITRGADKWLEIETWQDTTPCLQKQKEQGRQIISTALSDRSVSMLDIDWTKPTTLVIGNEKDGVTQEAMDLSDELCIIPTVGFSQSFNLSVAAAILLNHIHLERSKANLNQGDLSDEDFLFQKAKYYFRSCPHAYKLLRPLKEKDV